MRFRMLIGFLLVITVITACQGPPPEVVYIVVTPTNTPESTEAASPESTTIPATQIPTEISQAPSVTEAAVAPPTFTATSSPLPSDTATSAPTATSVPPTQGPTPLPPNFPTPVVEPVQVAEELFEHGRMFWLEPIKQIWVLKITGEGHGTWEVYEDTFKDGEPENDPSLVPPEGRYQPQRGFGKLWRESPGLREALGWGVTPEFGYVSQYEYHYGGTIDANGNYVPGPGYHIVYSLDGELFRLNEADGTWQLGNN